MAYIVARADRAANYNIEGPTRKEAARMADLVKRHKADAEAASAAGDDDRAFDLDCRAFDLEVDLRRFGFNPATGRPTR
jgi:hypothetical protein